VKINRIKLKEEREVEKEEREKKSTKFKAQDKSNRIQEIEHRTRNLKKRTSNCKTSCKMSTIQIEQKNDTEKNTVEINSDPLSNVKIGFVQFIEDNPMSLPIRVIPNRVFSCLGGSTSKDQSFTPRRRRSSVLEYFCEGSTITNKSSAESRGSSRNSNFSADREIRFPTVYARLVSLEKRIYFSRRIPY